VLRSRPFHSWWTPIRDVAAAALHVIHAALSQGSLAAAVVYIWEQVTVNLRPNKVFKNTALKKKKFQHWIFIIFFFPFLFIYSYFWIQSDHHVWLVGPIFFLFYFQQTPSTVSYIINMLLWGVSFSIPLAWLRAATREYSQKIRRADWDEDNFSNYNTSERHLLIPGTLPYSLVS
jgi:hypothetical protein